MSLGRCLGGGFLAIPAAFLFSRSHLFSHWGTERVKIGMPHGTLVFLAVAFLLLCVFHVFPGEDYSPSKLFSFSSPPFSPFSSTWTATSSPIPEAGCGHHGKRVRGRLGAARTQAGCGGRERVDGRTGGRVVRKRCVMCCCFSRDTQRERPERAGQKRGAVPARGI